MNIDTNSWHYRWYIYWLQNGRANRPTYRENLCHYVRVLLFWAPMTWIDQHTRLDWGKMGKWGYVGFMLLYLGGILIFGLLVAAITQTTKFLMAIGSLAALLAFIGAFIMTVRWFYGHPPSIPGTVKLGAAYVVTKKRRICPFLTFEAD